jgi:hypothetical protein
MAVGIVRMADRDKNDAPFTRVSNGFEQFVNSLQVEQPLSVLDLGGASQANLSFLASLGHRLCFEDLVGSVQEFFGPAEEFDEQRVAADGDRFIEQTLNLPPASIDAALVWDSLQVLCSPLIEQMVGRLLNVMRPGGLILAFFNADEKATRLPLYHYRIQDSKTLLLTPRRAYRQLQHHNNRSLERMFGSAHSLKFFLTRDHLREVIIRR